MLFKCPQIDAKREGLPLKQLLEAVDRALHSPDSFPQAALAAAVNQMEVMKPLPQLFMRSVMQASGASKSCFVY